MVTSFTHLQASIKNVNPATFTDISAVCTNIAQSFTQMLNNKIYTSQSTFVEKYLNK